VQLGLDLPYPPLGLAQRRPLQRRRVGIHRRPPGLPASSLPTCWLPSPRGRLSRPPTTTKPPPHPNAISRRRACPPLPWLASGEGDHGWFPRSPRTDRRGRCPAISRPPRHEYAAAFPRGLLTGLNIPAPESPAPCSQRTRTTHRPRSTRFESARRLRDFTRWFLSYTFSSRLPDPRRLAVPTRPVVVRTAPHPPRRLPDQAVLSFSQAAATAQRQGPSTPTRSHWRLVAHEHIIKPATSIGHRPSVQLGLHPKYPRPRLRGVDGPRDTGIHQCVSSLVCVAAILLGPFPRWPAFPASEYYGPSAPSRPDRQAMRPPGPVRRWRQRPSGRAGTVPTFIREPFDGIGTQLCPCTIATTTPQAFTVASPTSDFTQPWSSPTTQGIIGCAVRSDPCPPGFGSVVQS